MIIVKKKSQRDKHLIEALVYQQGPISRVGIHALTNLRRSTISALTLAASDRRKVD